jgi:hypothetical protein
MEVGQFESLNAMGRNTEGNLKKRLMTEHI